MSGDATKKLLIAVAEGKASVDEAMIALRQSHVDTVADSGSIVARLDTHRKIRHGFPEVILAEGKQYSHLERVVEQALKHDDNLLVTRVKKKRAVKLIRKFPVLTHARQANCVYRQKDGIQEHGLVAVLSAGTSDVGVGEEAALIARLMGARVVTHFDAGVAGLHRLLAAEDLLKSARVFIVCAGMEGALASVVGGLVDKPVIAVPTSVGYGAAFGGGAALLGMLNSCSANVTVVNIDNGFGAGYVAGLINRLGNADSELSA